MLRRFTKPPLPAAKVYIRSLDSGVSVGCRCDLRQAPKFSQDLAWVCQNAPAWAHLCLGEVMAIGKTSAADALRGSLRKIFD